MRSNIGGVAKLSRSFEDVLSGWNLGLNKPHISGLSDIVASLLSIRSVNTIEMAQILPRDVEKEESKQRYIWRFLSHPRINPLRVMEGVIPHLIQSVTQNDATAVLMLDQTQITSEFQCLMLSLSFQGRAQPLVWKVVKMGRGNIGYEDQEPLLRYIHRLIPENTKVMLSADRFYGTQSLIGLCQELNFSYRIRLKSNLLIRHEDTEISLKDAVSWKLLSLKNAQLGNIKTNIGILQEDKHPEPWIIAMDANPTPSTILDYGLRWGIESMFSDLKTRGFSVTKTQLTTPDRIERLLMILGFAMLFAVLVGTRPPLKNPSKKQKRSLTSAFKEGLRIITFVIINGTILPGLLL
jgi:hypothetical protein